MTSKPKLSMYWASSCGGCEIALLGIHERILGVDRAFEFFFCPCVLDGKVKDVEALPDGDIAITFFNGAIRNRDNQRMAELLRRKSRVLVAFGACACHGGIPALANFNSVGEHLQTNYQESPAVVNPDGVLPRLQTEVAEGELELPELLERTRTLDQVVAVDYYLPGCPPEPERIWEAIGCLTAATPPPKGAILGAGRSSVCNECARRKETKDVAQVRRTFEFCPDEDVCLLEQGIACLGVVTRDGCRALCPAANMPCTGCYGPAEAGADQGARMVAALASVLDLGDYAGVSERRVAEKTADATAGLVDPAGTFYKYSSAASALRGRRQ